MRRLKIHVERAAFQVLTDAVDSEPTVLVGLYGVLVVVIGDDFDSGRRLALPVDDDTDLQRLVRNREIAKVDDGGSRFGFIADEDADLAVCADVEVGLTGGERGRGKAAVDGRVERPLGPLRGDRGAELVS